MFGSCFLSFISPKPILLFPIRLSRIFSIPSKAPAQINETRDVSKSIYDGICKLPTFIRIIVPSVGFNNSCNTAFLVTLLTPADSSLVFLSISSRKIIPFWAFSKLSPAAWYKPTNISSILLPKYPVSVYFVESTG